MKKTRYTESQIIKVLHEVEGGRMIKDVCREYVIFERDLLQLEIEVWRHDGLGCQKA